MTILRFFKGLSLAIGLLLSPVMAQAQDVSEVASDVASQAKDVAGEVVDQAKEVVTYAKTITPYVSAGLALNDIDNGGLDYTSAQFRGGLEFNRYIRAEVEGGFGLGSQDFGAGVTAKMPSQFGAYGVLGLPVFDRFTLYSRLGYGTYDRRVEFRAGPDSSDTVSGLSAGFGIEALFGEKRKNGVRLDTTGLIGLGGDDKEFMEENYFVSAAYVRRF